MTQTTAKITRAGKHFEILVNMEHAIKFRKGEVPNVLLETDQIFLDMKKGNKAATNDLMAAFGTADINEVAKKIVKDGEVNITQDFRDAEQDKRVKQVIDFLVKNGVDPKTGMPHTPERLKNAIEQAHINIKNAPIEGQINDVLSGISKLIPIKIATKKIKITIPAIHTGQAYGIVAAYKESENWLSNGDLEVIIKIPAGMVMTFYDRLNSITHGSALTEEIKEKE